MASAASTVPSTGGITSTIYKGTCVLSAQSNRYTHKRPGGSDLANFTGARANLLDAGGNIDLPAGVPTVIEFSDTDFDTDGYFDISDATHLIIPTGLGGVFEIGYSGLLVGTSGELGLFQAYVLRNDTDILILGRDVVNTVIDGAVLNGNALFDLADSDQISILFSWNGVNDDALQTDVEYSPALWVGRWK